MSFYDYITGIDVRTVNMERMMRRFHVDDALATLPQRMRTDAVERCRSCGRQELCRAWLDAGTQAPEPPAYCRNGQLIDDLRRSSPA
jgi:hypothetical protein